MGRFSSLKNIAYTPKALSARSRDSDFGQSSLVCLRRASTQCSKFNGTFNGRCARESLRSTDEQRPAVEFERARVRAQFENAPPHHWQTAPKSSSHL